MYLSTFLLIQACSLVCAQVVSPYPVSNCDGLAGTDLQCPDQPGCCSGGAMCCAGGCCPLSAVCVNSGTSNEQCCDLSDKSLCGAAVTDSSPSCPTAVGIHPSKLCVGVDSDWYCPWDAVCNNAGGGCIGGRVKRDNCHGQATETAAETAEETAVETESDSFTDDFATTTKSSALSTVVDTSASQSETKTSLAVSVYNLPTVLLAVAFVFAVY
ncbi:hypothetical protein IWW34DRAFT_735497 [Fusarium oxysporum f. sp. albedinis]|nr:hypothetical protein FOMA001_g10618 [Fusarium oxysporum f. sp. matthiolae]KAI3581758.1 hypothetical protein IWW34DRAFT_735497 [Fusarium oxysporum f. sp. albedinis]